jgi:hypothetical protein
VGALASDSSTFPHIKVNVKDNSARSVTPIQIAPLHTPIFFIQAATGPVDVPSYGPYVDHVRKYGEETFAERSKYYSHQTIYAKAAMSYQPVFIVRVADANAKKGGLVVQVSVTQESVIQYQKSMEGTRIKDVNGDDVPLLEADGVTPVSEPGLRLVWSTRPLGANETYTQILPTTVGQTTTYPVIAMSSEYVGSGINNTGIRLYSSLDVDTTAVDSLDAMVYRLAPVSLTSTGIPLPIRNIYDSSFSDICFKENAIDAKTDLSYDLVEVLRRDYYTKSASGNRESTLPFKIHCYYDFLDNIHTQAADVSTELNENKFRINIISGKDASGILYDHLVVDDASASVVNEYVTMYNVGGSDGNLDKETFENLVAAYVTGDVYPEIKDNARYPITHIYDSGFALARKKDLLKIFAIRDDVKIDMCTQDSSLPPNTKSEDQSTGAALRAAALLYPESTKFGTRVCRVSIYQQCGYLNESTSYRPVVPLSYDRLLKRCAFDGTNYIKGEPKGRPNSEVSSFQLPLSWSPTSADHRQMSWDTGMNYAEYADMNIIFYADLRSIYPLDTSLLSSDVFVDYIIYLKHIARHQWTIFAGRTDDPETLYDQIITSINRKVHDAFGSRLTIKTNVYQTERDAELGYQYTIELNVYGNMPQRVWNVVIPVDRKSALTTGSGA